MRSDAASLISDVLARGGLVSLALLPIPPELLLPFAGFQVARGELGFLSSFLVATTASVIAALPLYAVARVGGRPLLLRHRRLLGLNERRLARAERWFERWGEAVVLFGRMVTGARSVVSVPAGLARMPLPRFLLWTALGFGSWNAVLLTAGLLLGERWERVSQLLGTAGPVVAVALASAALIFALRGVYAHRRSGARKPASGNRALFHRSSG